MDTTPEKGIEQAIRSIRNTDYYLVSTLDTEKDSITPHVYAYDGEEAAIMLAALMATCAEKLSVTDEEVVEFFHIVMKHAMRHMSPEGELH